VLQSRFGSWKLALDLSAEEGLVSHLPAPDEFDSQVEQEFAVKWGTEPRDGWRLIREGEVLHSAQKVFIPDFVFRHDDGRPGTYGSDRVLDARVSGGQAGDAADVRPAADSAGCCRTP